MHYIILTQHTILVYFCKLFLSIIVSVLMQFNAITKKNRIFRNSYLFLAKRFFHRLWQQTYYVSTACSKNTPKIPMTVSVCETCKPNVLLSAYATFLRCVRSVSFSYILFIHLAFRPSVPVERRFDTTQCDPYDLIIRFSSFHCFVFLSTQKAFRLQRHVADTLGKVRGM